jgi:glycosyltransferase involved in cell wall biosynthesis
MPRFADRLRERFTEERFDVVHSHFWMSGVASLAAARTTGVPVVQTFHALGSVKRRHQGVRDTSPPTRIEHERRLCRSVDHVVATCTDELAELLPLGLPAGRASVIPCGVDTELFRPVPADGEGGAVPAQCQHDRPRLLVIGRLVERKGVGNVIEALAALPGVELIVAGGPATDLLDSDPEVDRLRRVAERLGVSDRVRFTGAVSRAEVPALMAAADVVVAVPWYEPFGIVPVEAMACGRPIVGSAVGGLLDSVVPGVTGELVPPRRPDLLAEVLHPLLADPARRAAYGRAGRRRAVSGYQWQRVAEATEGVYAAVVREAAARRPSLRQHQGVSR